MDLDLCYAVAPIALALGVLVGRYTKNHQGIKEINSVLANLNESAQEAAKRKIKFTIYHSRFHVFSRFLLCLYIITAGLLMYHQNIYILYDNYMMLGIAIGLLILTYGSTLITYWMMQDSDKRIELYKQQIVSNKSKLIKDLGQSVIEALKEDETCNAKCREKTEKLEKELSRKDWFIKELSSYQWCDGCAQGSACTNQCGPKFFNFTKRCYQGMKSVS